MAKKMLIFVTVILFLAIGVGIWHAKTLKNENVDLAEKVNSLETEKENLNAEKKILESKNTTLVILYKKNQNKLKKSTKKLKALLSRIKPVIAKLYKMSQCIECCHVTNQVIHMQDEFKAITGLLQSIEKE